MQHALAPIVTRIDARDRPSECWDDPARGTLRWRTLISAPTTPTTGLVCGIAEMAEGDHFAAHRHEEPEVYFGLEGEGVVVIDGAAHWLSPGVAIYIPSMAEHGVPTVSGPLRWVYTFARDGFDQIAYQFTHEDPDAGQRQA
jgi:mannose-6-phosphate isomerase-like protein (cupin superfamily)